MNVYAGNKIKCLKIIEFRKNKLLKEGVFSAPLFIIMYLNFKEVIPNMGGRIGRP